MSELRQGVHDLLEVLARRDIANRETTMIAVDPQMLAEIDEHGMRVTGKIPRPGQVTTKMLGIPVRLDLKVRGFKVYPE